MSFTRDIKNEITREQLDFDQQKAQMCALFLIKGHLSLSNRGLRLVFESDNATVAKYVYTLLKDSWHIQPALSVLRKMKLKKNNTYALTITNNVEAFLKSLTIMQDERLCQAPDESITAKEANAKAFLMGAFLAAGGITDPKSGNYHLEFRALSKPMAEFLQKQLARFGIMGKIINRKQNVLVYVKASDQIGDFLRLLNASVSLFAFEDIRIQRDFVNYYKRLNNCDVANEMKSMKAAARQLEDIELIESSGIPVDEKLKTVMAVRREMPEATVSELCTALESNWNVSISKSGLKHRLNRIRELAESLRENN